LPKALSLNKEIYFNYGICTILLVEQKVQESLEIVDRGYIVQTGKIVRAGSSRELLNPYKVKPISDSNSG